MLVPFLLKFSSTSMVTLHSSFLAQTHSEISDYQPQLIDQIRDGIQVNVRARISHQDNIIHFSVCAYRECQVRPCFSFSILPAMKSIPKI